MLTAKSASACATTTKPRLSLQIVLGRREQLISSRSPGDATIHLRRACCTYIVRETGGTHGAARYPAVGWIMHVWPLTTRPASIAGDCTSSGTAAKSGRNQTGRDGSKRNSCTLPTAAER